ncbi:MAG: UDP-N-acetylmuramate--L-alanine ligase [Campylobacterota bacterium]
MRVHFIGIGGIGLSGLAKFLQHDGYSISGSDMKSTPITDALVKAGAKLTIPHSCNAISGQELVIHSAAIKPNNVELRQAKEAGIKSMPRSEALKFILQDKQVYSVAGAHGKSTTSAILASLLENSSAIIGAISKDFGSNVRIKNKKTLVFEADESDASFLNSNPYCAVVTNAEPEHMEFYGYDEKRFYEAYTDFIKKATKRVLYRDDAFLKSLDVDATWLCKDDIKDIEFVLKDKLPYTRFRLKDLGEFEVYGFGEHIAIDASLAILAALQQLPLGAIKKNIKNYKGIKKRFDIIHSDENLTIIDDYAHHPTEIKATMSSAIEFARLSGKKPVTAIWQPHKYSRTIDNLQGFKECFKGCDRLIILPVYSVGEEPCHIDFEKEFSDYEVIFADSVHTNQLFKDDTMIADIKQGLILGLGAGDITYQLRGQI